MLKSVQINWIPLYQLIIINWNNWKIETIGVCFCREIPNVGNHLREIEEGPPFLLKWVLRLDMQLQTEPEQFGIWYLWDWRGPSLPTQVTSETWFAIANRVRAIWDFWFVRLRRALSPYSSDLWDLFWNCKPSQSNLEFGICEIEEDSLSLLKWLLRLDMKLQTESEQFGTCSPLNNKWHFHGLKLDLCAIVLSSYAF